VTTLRQARIQICIHTNQCLCVCKMWLNKVTMDNTKNDLNYL